MAGADTILVESGDGVVAVPADVMAPEDALATDGLALVVSTGAIPFSSSETIVVGAHAVENNGVEAADLLGPRAGAVDDIVSPRELVAIEAENDAAVAEALRTTLRGYVSVASNGSPARPRYARESEGADGEGAFEQIGLDVRGLLADFIDAEFVRQLLPVTGVDAIGRTSFSVMGIGEFVLERTADGSAMSLTETTTGLNYAHNEPRDLVGARGGTVAQESGGGAPRPAAVASDRRLTDLIKDIAKAVVTSPWPYAALLVFLIALIIRRGRMGQAG